MCLRAAGNMATNDRAAVRAALNRSASVLMSPAPAGCSTSTANKHVKHHGVLEGHQTEGHSDVPVCAHRSGRNAGVYRSASNMAGHAR